jgi:hypothetical protein
MENEELNEDNMENIEVLENLIREDENGDFKEWKDELFAVLFERVSDLVREDGSVKEIWPFVDGGAPLIPAFRVIQERIDNAFSEDPDDSYSNIVDIACKSYMLGAFVMSATEGNDGYSVRLTKEQISQVIKTFVNDKINEGL